METDFPGLGGGEIKPAKAKGDCSDHATARARTLGGLAGRRLVDNVGPHGGASLSAPAIVRRLLALYQNKHVVQPPPWSTRRGPRIPGSAGCQGDLIGVSRANRLWLPVCTDFVAASINNDYSSRSRLSRPLAFLTISLLSLPPSDNGRGWSVGNRLMRTRQGFLFSAPRVHVPRTAERTPDRKPA